MVWRLTFAFYLTINILCVLLNMVLCLSVSLTAVNLNNVTAQRVLIAKNLLHFARMVWCKLYFILLNFNQMLISDLHVNFGI